MRCVLLSDFLIAQESRMREEKQTRTIAVLQHSRQDLSDGKDAA